MSTSGTSPEPASSRPSLLAEAVIWLPNWCLRLVLWVLTRLIYSIKVLGRDNVPRTGGALLIANHMSFADVLLISAAARRPVRFLVFQDIYDHPALRPFLALLRAIPISPDLRPRDKIRSLQLASQAVRNGELVCVFAEGQISRTGQMLPFRRGVERIMKNVDAPIIPVNLHGVWGSIFSFERGRFVWKLPRHVPYPVTVSFGTAMPASSSVTDIRQAVQELGSAAFEADRHPRRTLDRVFVHSCRRYPWRFYGADARIPKMNFANLLMKTIFVARRLRPVWGDQEMVGILLPPSMGGALTNYAATLLGYVPVNLNYTASNELISASVTQCNLKQVITSRAFLDKIQKIEVPCPLVMLEDLLTKPSPKTGEKLAALVIAWLLPFSLLKRALGARMRTTDDLATVIFSSGSTGDPKGVMLTHHNIVSNIRQMTQVFYLDGHDKLLGILPFFHSFGFTVCLWLSAAHGVGVVYHPNPLEPQVIGELVQKYRVTFLIATPTFLQAYMRRCTPEQFRSLRVVLVGAEKMPDRLAQSFQDRYGVNPFEGYGCTECSPVVSVNIADFRAPGFRQVGVRRGTIGHPLPGVSVRILDPETSDPATAKPLPPGTPGMLAVKGPNVMKGYLGRPDKTAQALHDGWYITGDIAAVAEDGFLTITDRLSRFSKIGGEMVPHIKVEEKLHELYYSGLGDDDSSPDQVFVVSAVPDERKGERLVVLHTLTDAQLAPVLARLGDAGLPPLWTPRRDAFFHVENLPYLGTGKLDLRALKTQAVAMAAAAA
jgi:acyl-[acyl-carrier-protein]-phospholipid O-acyltransferase / long-chain-fatty-acid--[acyl-carrier-protein] ligase